MAVDVLNAVKVASYTFSDQCIPGKVTVPPISRGLHASTVRGYPTLVIPETQSPGIHCDNCESSSVHALQRSDAPHSAHIVTAFPDVECINL